MQSVLKLVRIPNLNLVFAMLGLHAVLRLSVLFSLKPYYLSKSIPLLYYSNKLLNVLLEECKRTLKQASFFFVFSFVTQCCTDIMIG